MEAAVFEGVDDGWAGFERDEDEVRPVACDEEDGDFRKSQRTAEIQHSLSSFKTFSVNDNHRVVVSTDRDSLLQFRFQSCNDWREKLVRQFTRASDRTFVMRDGNVDEREPILP